MSALLHIILYIPVTMALGAYAWVKQDALKGAVAALIAKIKAR